MLVIGFHFPSFSSTSVLLNDSGEHHRSQPHLAQQSMEAPCNKGLFDEGVTHYVPEAEYGSNWNTVTRFVLSCRFLTCAAYCWPGS